MSTTKYPCKNLKEIRTLYQNVRGLRTKTTLLFHNVSVTQYDIIALTETFLTDSVMNGELFPAGYVVLRRDRVEDAGWGGVLLAVKEEYSVCMITDVDGLTEDKEVLFAILTWKNIRLFVCCLLST